MLTYFAIDNSQTLRLSGYCLGRYWAFGLIPPGEKTISALPICSTIVWVYRRIISLVNQFTFKTRRIIYIVRTTTLKRMTEVAWPAQTRGGSLL